MKHLKAVFFVTAFLFSVTFAMAQSKSEAIPVSGNCGMCKSKIEKAAKTGGAEEANWDKDKKILTVKFDEKNTDASKIQQAIANVGYDTRDVKGNDEAYKNLHSCCKYDRTMTYKSNASEKNKGGELDCCDKDVKGNKQACTDKAATAGKKVAGKSCCEKK